MSTLSKVQIIIRTIAIMIMIIITITIIVIRPKTSYRQLTCCILAGKGK